MICRRQYAFKNDSLASKAAIEKAKAFAKEVTPTLAVPAAATLSLTSPILRQLLAWPTAAERYQMHEMALAIGWRLELPENQLFLKC